MRIHLLVVACAVAAASFPAAAQQMKPGLWEIHNKMDSPETDRAMADMQKQLAAMSPQERKQMEAVMAQQGVRMAPAGAPGGGITVRMCMTREMTERNDPPMQDGCRMTQNSRSGNTMKMAFTCANPPSSGEGQYTFTSPEAYGSRMTIKTMAGGRPETTTMETRGKWLKADCGSVKPVNVPKK